jgi:hypothetical protein
VVGFKRRRLDWHPLPTALHPRYLLGNGRDTPPSLGNFIQDGHKPKGGGKNLPARVQKAIDG